jgi:hypothetical protein
MPELTYDWCGTTIAVDDESGDRADRLWQFAFDGSKALAEAKGWEMLPGCMRREPVGGDDDSGEIVAYTWPVARVGPRPGEFCDEHFSWLCQAGQGQCQRDFGSSPEAGRD